MPGKVCELTEEEWEAQQGKMLKMFRGGRSLSEIAEHFGMSTQTARRYLRYEKPKNFRKPD